jgi:hypothetical protein
MIGFRSNRIVTGLAALALALVLAPAIAAGLAGGSTATGNARLESMQIEIWPEYDRPAALVILRGELAADVALPAAVSLRIPASSGGPAAVAYAAAKKAKLLNLRYDRSDAGEFIALRFAVPERFFHVEFYDRLATGKGERTYRYLWPGDLPVAWLDVVVQEPAGASDLSVLPALDQRATGSEGLLYRSAQLGPAKQGTPLPVEVRYTKTDPRVSVEILKLNTSALPADASPPPWPKGSAWLYLAAGAAVLLAAAAGVAYSIRRRRRSLPQGGPAGSARFCAKCGNGMASGDRFCSKCGAPLG